MYRHICTYIPIPIHTYIYIWYLSLGLLSQFCDAHHAARACRRLAPLRTDGTS